MYIYQNDEKGFQIDSNLFLFSHYQKEYIQEKMFLYYS